MNHLCTPLLTNHVHPHAWITYVHSYEPIVHIWSCLFIIIAGGYVFNTEAHPIDIAALYCCSAERHDDLAALHDLHDNIDLLELLGLVDSPDEFFMDPSQRVKRQNEENKRKQNLKKLNFNKVHWRRGGETLQKDKVQIVEIPKGKFLNSEQTETESMVESNGATVDNGIGEDIMSEHDDSVGDDDVEGTCEATEVIDYNRLKHEESAYYETRLLTCPALPFHMRLSLMGEMFPNSWSPSMYIDYLK